MTSIYFVRHAQSDFNWPDDATRPLTAEALDDLAQVENFFSSVNVDYFYSSPFKRAVDTIGSVAKQKNKPILLDSRFRERAVGKDGQKPELLKQRWEDFNFSEPLGESLQSVQQRNIEALSEILAKHRKQTVAIGTHGTALSTVYNYYNRSFGLNDFLEILDLMPFITRFTFDGTDLKAIETQVYIRKTYNGSNNLKALLGKV